jgi:hypothetical protein
MRNDRMDTLRPIMIAARYLEVELNLDEEEAASDSTGVATHINRSRRLTDARRMELWTLERSEYYRQR